MMRKNKLAAAVVMSVLACSVCQGVWADEVYVDASTIDSAGTYNFKAGSTTKQLIDYWCHDANNTNITINIENNGTLQVQKKGQWILDFNCGDDHPISSNGQGNIIINGNLDLTVDCDNSGYRNDPKAINLFNNNDKLKINGYVKINMDNIKTTAQNYWAEGIRIYTGSAEISGNISIDSINAASTAANGQYGAVTGIYGTTTGDRAGANTNENFTTHIVLGSDSTTEVKIKNINALSEAGYTSAIGIVSEGNHSVVDVNGKADITNIKAQSNDGHAESIALYADNKGIINIKGDLNIDNIEGSGTTNEVVALQVYQGGIINVNAANDANRIINIVGDIDGGNIADGGKIALNLLNKNSSITGASTGNVDMQLSNGATWFVKDRHFINDLAADADIKDNHIHSLTGNDGIIQIDIDASKNNDNNTVSIDEHSGAHFLNLLNTNTANITTGANGTVLVNVGQENGIFKVQSSENGLYWQTYELDKKDNNGSTEWYIKSANKTPTIPSDPSAPSTPNNPVKPTTSVSTLLSTITAGYDTWRSDTDKLSERLGELRLNDKDTEGVWVRTKGSKFGRHGGNGVYTNKQQTYQLGYDAVTRKNAEQTTYTGIAAEYGKGNLSFEHGTGTMKSLGLGLYQTQMRESGHYLDFVYKFDKYKNDFHVADTAGNPISGKYGNNAMSLSAEYGRQNALKHGWYVEPQAELTLGYMWGNDFVTSNNIRVEQKNMPALIGRLGLNIGRNIGDKVNFYVKASMNHDFLGKYDLHMTDLTTGDRLNANDNFGSSWFDYGAGLTVKTTNNSYAYFDIERAVGGEYKKNWDWNVGLRWSF